MKFYIFGGRRGMKNGAKKLPADLLKFRVNGRVIKNEKNLN